MQLSVEDRIALQDLIAAYSWALDTGDAEGLVACFTEDCVMSEEVFGEFEQPQSESTSANDENVAEALGLRQSFDDRTSLKMVHLVKLKIKSTAY